MDEIHLSFIQNEPRAAFFDSTSGPDVLPKVQMNITSSKWLRRLLDAATHFSTWSKDPSTKVGAVLVTEEGDPVSWGYNGPPRELNDDEIYSLPREEKLFYVEHAERNVLFQAGERAKGCTLFSTHFPCADCARMIVKSGVKRVVVSAKNAEFRNSERWAKNMDASQKMFDDSNIEVIIYDNDSDNQ